jgi:preprotein translocase subunit SecG
MSILLNLLTGVLVFVSLFLVLIVLMQKSKDGGMGAALGGGAAEAAFGADTSNVLSKSTIYAAVLFFILAFTLYLGRIWERNHSRAGGALPAIAAPAVLPTPAPAPGATAPATTAPAVTLPGAPAPATTTPEVTTPAPKVETPAEPAKK